MKTKDIMSKEIISCDINKSIEDVAKLMLEYDIGFMPITKDNKIIGVLTDRDIVVKIIANNDNKIEGYIKTDLTTIDSESGIDDVLKLMSKNKIKRVLVTDNDNFIGVVSLSDIIKCDIDVCETIKNIWDLKKRYKESNVDIDDYEL